MPADVIGNAVHLACIATSDIEDDSTEARQGKNAAAAELGRTG